MTDRLREPTAGTELTRRIHTAQENEVLSTLEGIHPRGKCVGTVCVIHNPTDHHMRHLPLHWRNDRGIFERICGHGVGHPDPDHLPRWEAFGWESNAIHGCCYERCCYDR